MRYFLLINMFWIVAALSSCKDDPTQKYVEQWQGKNIEISDDATFLMYGRDTVLFEEYRNAKTKIFVFVDSLGCTSCKLKLRELYAFNNYLKDELKTNIPILLYFDNKNIGSVAAILKTHGYKEPILIDTTGEMSKRYTFSRDLTMNSFLLDSLNRVILIGYPMHNKEIEKMYINEILKRQ